MTIIEWDEAYSTENAEIDEQHRQWFAIYNEAHRKMVQGSIKELKGLSEEALRAMQEYADYHFRFEENYMMQINYPALVEHRRLHKDFDSMIYQYNREIRKGNMVLNSEVLKILREWLVNHILREDKKISEYARAGNGARSDRLKNYPLPTGYWYAGRQKIG